MTAKDLDAKPADIVARARNQEYGKRRVVKDRAVKGGVVRGGVDFLVGTKVVLQIRRRRLPPADETPYERDIRLSLEQARWTSKDVGGRPPKVNWDRIKTALEAEIADRGEPNKENRPGWRTHADVERWVDQYIIDNISTDGAAEATIRSNVRRILKTLIET